MSGSSTDAWGDLSPEQLALLLALGIIPAF